jgi:hypothetical protein
VANKRIGMFEGKCKALKNVDADNEVVAKLFGTRPRYNSTS